MGIQIDHGKYIGMFLDYTKSDVEYLLNDFSNNHNTRPHAGPLLMTIMSGIDALGGIIYGFACGSQDRSVQFMVDYMNITEPLARFVYVSVRCGVIHHGVPKTRVKYELWSDEVWSKMCSSSDAFCVNLSENQIYINVAKLADTYLLAIKCIIEGFQKDPSNFAALGLEGEVAKAEPLFNDAFNSISARNQSLSSSSSSEGGSYALNPGSGNIITPDDPDSPEDA